MKPRRITLLAALAAVVSTAAASEGQAGGGTAITLCAQVVTTHAYLTADLPCPGSSGVVVGADGITIDLKGFRLRGNRTAGHYGIDDSGGYDGVRIKNGVMRSFDYGLYATGGADDLSISGLLVSGNAHTGIYVFGSATAVKSSTSAGNDGDGILVNGASATVQSSTVFGNTSFGIELHSDLASVKSSTATGNSGIGISVLGDADKI